MLSSMRKTAHSFFVKILLILLIASFALWGIGDIVGNSGSKNVATVGDDVVSEQAYYSELSRLRTNLGEYFQPEILQRLNLYQVTLNELVSKSLIKQESDALNIRIGDELLKDALASKEEFHNNQGLFDRRLFEQRLRQLRMNEQQYLAALQDELQFSLIEGTIIPNAMTDTTLADILYQIEEEEREVLAFVIDSHGKQEINAPEDANLRVFYETNKADYMAPEYRILNYITLDDEAAMKDVEVTENELRDVYFKRQTELATPEKRDITQLLYKDKASAESAYSLLRSSHSIEKVLKEAPPFNEDTTALGEVTKNQLPAAEDTVFAAGKGDFTTPVQSEFGWHIFYVNNIIKSKTPSFESMKDELEIDVKRDKAERSFAALLERFEDAAAAGLPLDQIADTMELPLQTSAAIDRTGRRSDNTVALDTVKYGEVITKGFGLTQDSTSDIMQNAKGDYFIVKTAQITAARQRTFEEVKGSVTQDWKDKETVKARKTYAQKLIKALEGVSSVANAGEILKKFDIKTSELIRVKRGGVNAASASTIEPARVPESFVTDVFVKKDEMQTIELADYQDNSFITGIYVKSLDLPNSASNPSYAELKKRLESYYQQEIRQQYLGALQQHFPVSQDNEAISRVISQF